MSLKLKVLHGAIKKHGKWQLTVPIKKSPFVIGQAADCHMRCYGRAISDYHCEIRIRGRSVFLCDLESDSGTFVNGQRITGEQRFDAGDEMRLGRLAFELLIHAGNGTPEGDPFNEYVSDMLLAADEVDRQERVHNPEERWYQIEPTEPRDPYEGMTPKERVIAKARKKLPPKQSKPAKLPRRRYVASSTEHAVIESLAIYYPGVDARSADRLVQ
jgi:predicted component of type VI protein secretion system